ncbi:hypothetical protein Bca101_097140 [Brassica carinata]
MVTNEPCGYPHASFLLVNSVKTRIALLSFFSHDVSSPLSLSSLTTRTRSEVDWSLSPKVERRRIMERTTKSLKLASVRLLSTRRHHHHRGARYHH